METLPLASGHHIPALGLGTWLLKGEECRKAVVSALKLGYTHIDTAWIYENQADIGHALAEARADRSGLFITSKIWRDHLRRNDVIKEVESALKDLGTKYLDLLLIHWPNRAVPMKETFAAMEGLVKQGMVRSIGVSNFTIRHLRQAMSATTLPISMNQVECHPYFFQRELISFCKQHGIVVTAYSPLGRGRLLSDAAITEIAKKRGRTPAQVVLRWLLDNGLVAIPKASSEEHLRENLGCASWRLSPAEIRRIDSLNTGKRLINPVFSEFDDTPPATRLKHVLLGQAIKLRSFLLRRR